MIPGIQYGLGVVGNQVILRYVDKEGGPQIKRPIKSVDDYAQFMRQRMKKFGIKDPKDLIVMCSSSMDFPEENTKNKKTVALARALR